LPCHYFRLPLAAYAMPFTRLPLMIFIIATLSAAPLADDTPLLPSMILPLSRRADYFHYAIDFIL
jgi:hypothetical protein